MIKQVKIFNISCFKVIILLCLLCKSFSGFCQHADSVITVRGVVIDSLTKLPVSYSTIELMTSATKAAPVKSFTAENGTFSFAQIQQKECVVIVRTLGYAERKVPIKPTGHDIDLGMVYIQSTTKLLNEVKIESKKPVIENKIDRIVFNPDPATIQSSITMADVLNKTPLLSVGQNGQIFLRGKSRVKIYLNDKPVPVDVIKGLPASSISNIEIITNPPAKYDADGVSIINIVTKKSKLDGYDVTILAGGGIYDRANGLVNINIKKSKLNIAATYSLTKLTNSGNMESSIQRAAGEQSQEGKVKNNQFFHFGNVTADYEIDSLNKIGGAVNLYEYVFKKNFNSKYTDSNQADSSGNYLLSTFDHIKRYGGYGELNYNHEFKKSKSSINFAVLFNQLKVDDDLIASKNSPYSTQLQKNEYLNNETFKEVTYQVNFSKQFKDRSKLEIGSKAIVRNNNSEYSDSLLKSAAQPINTFKYNQTIYAVYGLYSFNISKLSIQLGLRNESTVTKTALSEDRSNYNYSNLFPSANMLYKIDDDQQVKLSYSEKIQRPGIFYLNPYLNPLDPQNITTGNPHLNPEITHQIGLDYSKSIGKSYIDLSVDYTKDNNAISSFVSSTPDDVLITSYSNAGASHSYSGSLFFSTVPFKKDNLNLSFTAEKYYISNSQTSNDGYNYYASFRNSASLTPTLNLNVSMNYFSRQITLQGKSPGSFSNNVGLSKSLFNRKCIVSFAIDDPFRLGGKFNSYTSGPGFSQRTANDINLRTFQLRASYVFGKKSNGKLHENKVKNSDLKNGGL